MANSTFEEDDPVVHEIDICLAKALAEKLFLFQYPVRPSSFSYDHTPHLATRMKPKQQKVELELGMDIGASTYCFPRGEQIAHAVDRGVDGNNQNAFFQSTVMDRHMLTSTRATQNSAKYAAAVYAKGALHITPVKGILQLRPSFNYFDKAEENQKKAAAALKADHEESQDEEEPEAKLVQLRFARNSKNSSKQANQKAQNVDEEWVKMEFHQPDDFRSKLERKLLYCHQNDFEAPEFTLTSRDYLKVLAPPEEQDSSLPADMPQGVLSLLKLKTMGFSEQVKALLVTAKVLQFTQLCVLLGGGLDDKIVLKALEQYAMLVQGCWVVKSEVLYPKGTKSQISGIDAEKIWPTRDYVMFCFNRKRVLSRKEVASTSRLPTEELREVLEQMGRQQRAQGWEFMLSADVDFLHKHHDVCTSQMNAWKAKYEKLQEQLHITEDFFGSDFKDTDFPGLLATHHRKPHTPRRRVTISDESSSPDKKNKPARRRSRSQSSQDGGDVVMTSDVKQEPKSPNKSPKSPSRKRDNEESRDQKKKPKASLDITKTLMEIEAPEILSVTAPEKNADVTMVSDGGESGSDIEIKKKSTKSANGNSSSSAIKNKKQRLKQFRRMLLDSDDEEDEDETRKASEKLGNEVEVGSNPDDEADENSNEDGSNIFVPPVAAGLKKPPLDTKASKDRPPSEIFLKELKKFCRDAIRSGCLSLAELKEVLALRQKEAGNILCTGVEDDLLVKCVLETGASEIPVNWGDCLVPDENRRVFLYKKLNESTDKYRVPVADMFRDKLCIKRKDILERLNQIVGEVPTNHTYSKFMVEFCENHNGHWYLHGTFQSLQKYGTTEET
ncbi:DNA-directed RNA polymerase III subunit RPC5-like [Clytia hemisphaerica]|uniref:DNA-directed RNA polymerase III subunit RPC5 C-terminal domain-containing protein n=1 Tax=Clytia hemisphaerica TaxID=252671 RepID=A0A7M5UJA6_9CNID